MVMKWQQKGFYISTQIQVTEQIFKKGHKAQHGTVLSWLKLIVIQTGVDKEQYQC